jgi:hypothetical protein
MRHNGGMCLQLRNSPALKPLRVAASSNNVLQRAIYLALSLASTAPLAWVQAPASGIYTCVDAKGRKLTSDRPIAECIDREQKILNPSGTVKSKLGPTLTVRESAELEKKEKQQAEEEARVVEEKRRNRALLIRYPNKAVHDQERADALAQITVVIQTATSRIDELARQRAAMDVELEFYKADISKAPAYLRRQVEENTHSMAVQKRFVSAQEAEVHRVNMRFDDELMRLRQLWTMVGK